MTNDTISLSPRHERFVAEYLKDSNATRAYLRAGYSPRGAQPSASRLLRRPDIAAAIAAGRERVTQALELSVERLAQEYAKIAFAKVDDFVTTDDDGRVRVDLEKAGEAQRAGIVELRIANNSKGEQRIALKLGKMQALAALTKHVGVLVAKPAPDLTAEDRERYEERFASQERARNHSIREQRRLEDELRETRAALEAAETRVRTSGIENPNPSVFAKPVESHEPRAAAPDESREAGPSEPPKPPARPAETLGMPIQRDYEHGGLPTSAEGVSMITRVGFPGLGH